MPQTEKTNKDKKPQELKRQENEEKASRPGNEVYIISRKRKWLERLILIASGIFFSFAFPESNWCFLAWITLIPLYFIIRDKTPFQAWRAGYLWGFFWAASSFFWIGEIESFNPPFSQFVPVVQKIIPGFNGGFLLPYIAGLVLGFFPALWAAALPFLRKYLLIPVEIQLQGHDSAEKFFKPSRVLEILYVFGLTSWWCITEWIRSWIATGLPWNFLATTQWQNIPLLQICDYTGVYGVSFLVALVNIALALAFEVWYKAYRQGRYRRPVPLILSFIIIMLSVITGSRSMLEYKKIKADTQFTATVIQGDIPQCRAASLEQVNYAMDKYFGLSELAAISKPDLIIWPETAVPIPLRGPYPICFNYRLKVEEFVKKTGVPLLIGTLDFQDVPEGVGKEAEEYNSAFFINKAGGIADKYHKIHIVPFGEFVPYSDWFPILEKLIGLGRNLSRGRDYSPIEIEPGVKAGINICFEDVFPYISRNEVLEGANLLITITNDAWYPTSSEPEQHLANSIFRCIENRRPMIRCGNNSCSTLILPNGAIKDTVFVTADYNSPLSSKKLLVSRRGSGYANFVIDLQQNPPLTFYTRFGDMFILLCSFIFGAALLTALWAWREKKLALQAPFERQYPDTDIKKKEKN